MKEAMLSMRAHFDGNVRPGSSQPFYLPHADVCVSESSVVLTNACASLLHRTVTETGRGTARA